MNMITNKSNCVDTKNVCTYMVIVYYVKCKYGYQEVYSVDTKKVCMVSFYQMECKYRYQEVNFG